MKILNSNIHGIIDYAVVLFLWLSPTLFGLSHTVATLTYVLGGVHLALTIFTDFKYGVIKIITLKIHGWIELAVGILLVATPLILQNSDDNAANKYFFVLFGVAVLLTWVTSDYDETRVRAAGNPGTLRVINESEQNLLTQLPVEWTDLKK